MLRICRKQIYSNAGTGEKWYGLVYDDAETLYMETKENEIIQTKYNAWGVLKSIMSNEVPL